MSERSRPSVFGFFPLVTLGMRRFRIEAAVIALMLATVATTTAGLAATPRFIDRAANEALDSHVDGAEPPQRNVSFTTTGRLAPTQGESQFETVAEQGDQYRKAFGPDLSAVIGETTFVVRSPTFHVTDLPVDPQSQLDRLFSFQHMSGSEEEITLKEGSWPAVAKPGRLSVRSCDPETREAGEDPCGIVDLAVFAEDRPALVEGTLPHRDEPVTIGLTPCDSVPTPKEGVCGEIEVAVFQTALTKPTADGMGLKIGDRVLIYPVIDTGLNQGLPVADIDYFFILEVSGLIETSEPGEEFWYGDSQLHAPSLLPIGFTEFQVVATGIQAEEDYLRLHNRTSPSRFVYSWRYFVDYERVDTRNIAAVKDDILDLDLTYPPPREWGQPRIRTNIDGIAQAWRNDAEATVSLASLVVFGTAGLLVGVVVVLGALAGQRRASSAVLVRSRGASPGTLALARFAEAIVLFTPAALVGALAGRLAVPLESESSFEVFGPAVVATAFAVIVTGLYLPYASGDLGSLMTGRTSHKNSIRRVVTEVTLILLAGAAAFTLTRRGFDVETEGFDPLLAATPLLLGVAAGIVLLRTGPLLATWASGLARFSRGLVGLIGLRSMTIRTVAAQIPSVILLIAVLLAVFGTTLAAVVADAQVEGSYDTVGANYLLIPQVTGSRLSPDLDVSSVDSIEAQADAVVLEAKPTEDGSGKGSVALLALDLADYQDVAEGTPADPVFAETLLRPIPEEDRGTESNPIPAIVSKSWPLGTPVVGQIIDVLVQARIVTIVVDDVRDRFAGLDTGQFMVASRADMEAAHGRLDVSADRRYLRAPDSASSELTSVVVGQSRGARLVSRPALVDALRTSPTVIAVDDVYRVALWISAVLAAIAVVGGFALTSAQRSRDLGYLRAVGLSSGQVSAATTLEQLPPAVAATAIGLAGGLMTALIVIPVIDLAPLTGTDLPVQLSVQWAPVLGVCAILLGTVLATTAIYSLATRRLDLAEVLRRGDRT